MTKNKRVAGLALAGTLALGAGFGIGRASTDHDVPSCPEDAALVVMPGNDYPPERSCIPVDDLVAPMLADAMTMPAPGSRLQSLVGEGWEVIYRPDTGRYVIEQR